jgi:hypothetical protein
LCNDSKNTTDYSVVMANCVRSNYTDVEQTLQFAGLKELHARCPTMDVVVKLKNVHTLRMKTEAHPHEAGSNVLFTPQDGTAPSLGTLLSTYTGVGKGSVCLSGSFYCLVQLYDADNQKDGDLVAAPIAQIHPDGRIVSKSYYSSVYSVSNERLADALLKAHHDRVGILASRVSPGEFAERDSASTEAGSSCMLHPRPRVRT